MVGRRRNKQVLLKQLQSAAVCHIKKDSHSCKILKSQVHLSCWLVVLVMCKQCKQLEYSVNFSRFWGVEKMYEKKKFNFAYMNHFEAGLCWKIQLQ
jgi:hypothetical protein